MKKIFTIALASIITLSVDAADLFTGSKHVSWSDGGLQITADKFADAKAGDKIVVTYSGASDGIEFKVMNGNFDRLPGSREAAWIGGDGTFEQFLTPAAVAGLKAHGLEIIGANFTATKVELTEGKNNVTENTIWTGYFWMDDWSTLEIVKTSFEGINWAGYKAIRFYSEANRTDYVINIKTSWDENGHIADQGSMNMTNEYAELSLEGVDMAAKLANADRLMIQCNKEGGNAFNFTAIELVPKTDAIQGVEAVQTKSMTFNLAGQRVRGKAKGIVVAGGKVYLNK